MIESQLPQFIKVTDMAKILKINRQKAYELIHSEDFPFITIGKSIRIPVNQFEKWLNKRAN